jgi:cytochrome c oxidase subunit 2
MNADLPLFPEQASAYAPRVDALYIFLLAVAVFFTALICLLILYFSVRYRRTAKVDRLNPPNSPLLELSWAIVPFILTMVMFFWGAILYFEQHQAPADADEIYVIGKQWMWKIQHANGKQEVNTLHVPVGRPVRLKMISEDVIHSFYVPAFRVKQDVLPGRYTSLWFKPTKPGRYRLFCAEYCGTSHAQMSGYVFAMEPSDYATWFSGGAISSEPPDVAGQQVFEQFRCNSCHRADGTGRCPSLEGIFGRTVQLVDGRQVMADEDYLRESILRPNAKVVAGFAANMPTYEGQISEQNLFQLIAYLKTRQQRSTTTEGDNQP